MATPSILVLRAPGINCDEETAFAWEAAGARAERIHVNRIIEQPALLDTFQVLTLPGGFSYGDDIAAGRILAQQIKNHLAEQLDDFRTRGGLILGICNGFQVLVRLGLLPGEGCPEPVSLSVNESGRYEDRWVRVRSEISHCPFLVPGRVYHLPVAHGEGRILAGPSGVGPLDAENRVALRYVTTNGESTYPENPNGSIENVAGLTDSTGRVLGLMPHPERCILATHLPAGCQVDQADNPDTPDGTALFESAVSFLR